MYSFDNETVQVREDPGARSNPSWIPPGFVRPCHPVAGV